MRLISAWGTNKGTGTATVSQRGAIYNADNNLTMIQQLNILRYRSLMPTSFLQHIQSTLYVARLASK